MATVPISQPSVQQQPAPPVYDNSAAPAAAFGADQAAAMGRGADQLGKMGDALSSIAIDIANKNSAIARASDMQAATNTAQQGLSAMATGENMTDPATVAKFSGSLDNLIDQTVGNHTGGPQSAAMLKANLMGLKTDMMTHANMIADKSRQDLIEQQFQSQLQPLTALVYSDPSQLASSMQKIHAVVADQAAARGQQASMAVANAATQSLLQSAVLGSLQNGGVQGIDAARSIVLQNSGILSPENQRILNDHIVGAAAVANRNQYEWNQHPVNFVASNTGAFLADSLGPVDLNRFQMMALQMAQPRTMVDPITHETTTYQGIPMQPAVRAKLLSQGVPLPAEAAPAAPTEPASSAPAANPNAGPVPGSTLGPGDPGYQAPASPSQPAQGMNSMGHKTIWQYNSEADVTGPGAAFARFMGAVPTVGGMVPSSDMTQANSTVKLNADRLMSAISNSNLAGSNKLSSTDLKAVEDSVNEIMPAKWDNKDRYADRLIALDDHLAELQQTYADKGNKMAGGAGQSPEVLAQARQLEQQVHAFRDTLGVPPTLSVAQMQTMPKNFEFRPNAGPSKGKIRYAPGPQAGAQ